MRQAGSKYRAFIRDTLWVRRKDEVSEGEESRRLVDNCKQRAIYFPTIHTPKGIFYPSKPYRDGVLWTSSHLFSEAREKSEKKGARPTSVPFVEEHSPLTGELRITFTSEKKRRNQPILKPLAVELDNRNKNPENKNQANEAYGNVVAKRYKEIVDIVNRDDDISFMKEKVRIRLDDSRTRWRKSIVGKKWPTLHTLFYLIIKSEHRFARTLSMAYIKGACRRYSLPKAEFTNIFLNNFAFTRQERETCSSCLQLLFETFDEDFDGMIDWRIFICHMNLMLNHKRKLETLIFDCFKLYAVESENEEISLAEVWEIIRMAALEYERPLIWEQFNQFLCKVHSSPQELVKEFHSNLPANSNQDIVYDLKRIQNLDLSDVIRKNVQDWDSITRRLPEYNLMRSHCYLLQYRLNSDYVLSNDNGILLKANEGNISQMRDMRKAITSMMNGFDMESQDTAVTKDAVFYIKCIGWPVLKTLCFDYTLMNKIQIKFYWDRIPADVRFKHCQLHEETAAAKYEEIDMKVRWYKASQWWKDVMLPRNKEARFLLWKRYTIHRRKIKKGMLHWRATMFKKGFEGLELFTERRIFLREQNRLADKFLLHLILNTHMRAWKDFCVIEKRLFEIEVKKAVKLYETYKLELAVKHWRQKAYVLRKLRESIERWRTRETTLRFTVWRDNVRALIKLKKDDEHRAEMRQKMLQADVKEERARLEAIQKQREWEEEQERLLQKAAEERQKLFDKYWENEKQKAYDSYERRKLLRQQEENQVAHKAERKEKEEKAFENTWDDLLKKTRAEAKREAEIYLNTQDGIEHMEKEVIQIQNDADNMSRTKGKGKELDEDSDWKKLYDPVFESYFFYNTETGEKMHALGLSKEEGMVIAKSAYIADQVKLAVEEVEKMKTREAEKRLMIKAAKKLQAAFKTRKARAAVYQVIVDNYVKRLDPYTGKAYYYNLRTRKSHWSKPINLGSKDMKPLLWNLRCDKEGKWYYENRTTPWLSSPEKPPHYLQCMVCNFQLATHTCDTCEEHYCLDCFEKAHPERITDHKYERSITLETKDCIMCKSAKASNYCKQCGLRDFYCDKCHKIIHLKKVSKKRKIPHVNVQF